ncbi:Prefoldin subunit alpha [uncultured archaeon]|nr:Prefoldin subunit alpha [uncultured archaeon]
MAGEDELERISNELQVQQAKGEAIRQQIQAMQGSILEVSAAMEALKNLQKAKGDTLVPLGAGVFMSCPKPDSDRIVMSIGAGVMVQKKPEETMKILEERTNRMSEAIGLAQTDLSQVIKSIESLTERAGVLSAAEERKNVRPSKEQAV